MTKQQTSQTAPQTGLHETSEKLSPAGKKPFVEPAVSVPADVLEATAMFQTPTIQAAIVPTPTPLPPVP